MTSSRRLSLLTVGAATSIHAFYSQRSYSEFNFWKSNPVTKSIVTLSSYSATYDANNPSEDRCIPSQVVKGWNCAAIFDGHGGWQVSEFASKTIFTELDKNLVDDNMEVTDTKKDSLSQILIQTFTDVEKKYLASVLHSFKLGYGEVAKVGCCALVVMKKDNHLIAANCGDCRAILATQSKPGVGIPALVSTPSFVATRLTNDHNAREPVEQEKLFREHPNEADVVRCHPNNPQACYVKGRLQLTRALGDAYLKYKEFNGTPGLHKSRYLLLILVYLTYD